MSEASLAEVRTAALKSRRAIIGGYGEPLLNSALLPFLEDLDLHGVHTSFSSNGHAFTPAIVERLSRLRHLDHINVSIDSPDPTIYRAIRRSSIERPLQGLRHLASMTHARDIVSVASILMKSNLDSLVAIPSLLAELGLRRYVVQAYIDYIGADHNRVDSAELKDGIERIARACHEAGIDLLHDFPDPVLSLLGLVSRVYVPPDSIIVPVRETRQCVLPWEIPVIDKDGRVFPCCRAESLSVTHLGSLTEYSFDEVWNGEAFRTFREGLVHGDAIPAVCQTCDLATLGVHPLRAYSAELLPEQSSADNGHVFIVARNTGAAVWRQVNPMRIGTTGPHDRLSRCAYHDWLTPNRPASMREHEVFPGELATFEFMLRSDAAAEPEMFQLVVDGVTWLPDAIFSITPLRPSLTHRVFASMTQKVHSLVPSSYL